MPVGIVLAGPQEHDGTATPDNFITALHDALIKNNREKLFDHPALAERFELPRTRRVPPSGCAQAKPHNGEPVTPEDVKFSFENYRGAKADVLKNKTERIEIVDQRTIRFHFKEPFLDFPLIFGTANVSGAGWVVPAKYYQQVGADRFKQKPIGAGPYKLVSQEAGSKLELEQCLPITTDRHQQARMASVCRRPPRGWLLERGEADLIFPVPGGTDRSGEEQSQADAGASVVGLVGGWSFQAFRTPRTRSTISACARP